MRGATDCQPFVSRAMASRLTLLETFQIVRGNGGEGQNRTVDTTIFSRMLYQLSYLATTTDFRVKQFTTISKQIVRSLITILKSQSSNLQSSIIDDLVPCTRHENQ